MRHECSVRPDDLGPYLLGQLGPDETALVEEAVATCPLCAAEVERLVPVAAALSRVTLPLEDAVPAPPALERVLQTVREEQASSRRRLRTRVLLAAASVVLVVSAVLGTLAVVDRPDAGRQVALSGQTSAGGAAEVAPRGWGTAITLDVRGLRPGTTYGAWLADGNGDRVPAGTFRPLADGTAHLDLSASMSLTEAASMGVTALGGADVLTARLDG